MSLVLNHHRSSPSSKFGFVCRSMILSRRANDDDSRDGFAKWPFMTTHTWGEYPQGTWTLEVSLTRAYAGQGALFTGLPTLRQVAYQHYILPQVSLSIYSCIFFIRYITFGAYFIKKQYNKIYFIFIILACKPCRGLVVWLYVVLSYFTFRSHF